ncbi:unnamed protein product [Mytilus coruscus]|uniref:Uncharacterized protein n=1 Tax=Mytilus coruscus TaxID=42192 RepID=A0A6J7ZZY4_MYTCO|nr:unnamed protein product [Mytilus coruscus]
MPRKKNCDIVHEGRQSGPCVHCRLHERTDRYIHLVQKKESAPEFYTFVKQIYLIEDEGCICRKCELKLIRRYEQQMLNQDIQDEGIPVKQQCVPHECPPSKKKALCYLAKNNLCNTDEKLIITSVEIGPFETCFHVAFDKKYLQPGNEQVTLDICQIHYMHFKNYAARSNCCICERSTTKLKRVNVEDRLQLFKVYLKEELQHETPDEDGKPIVCLSCYKAFNKYTKSDDQEKSRAKTDMYLTDCLSSIEIMECNISNIDTYCYQNILKYVVSGFLSYKPLLLSKVYNVYASEVDKAVKDFNLVVNNDRLRIVQHSATWLFYNVEILSGTSSCFTCSTKQKTNHHKEIDELNNKMSALEKKVNSNIASSSSLNTMECLDKTARLMKTHVKLYVQDAIKTQLPDIHCFDLYEEIKKINPTLWNLIYVLTSNEEEEKIWRQSYFSWNKHYMTEDKHQNCRLFPRLYIASCIFHANSSHCVQPLHLLASDILDKYSNSSSDLLTINSRLGAGISKDTLKRFITNRVMQLNRDNVISSESFALASFDNLDKNQSYALVGSGKDKSGFHGTTIQAVIPKPSEKNENLDIASHEHIEKTDHRTRIEMSSNRTLPSDIIKSLKEPNNLIGEPSEVKYNKFQALKLVDFNESEVEKHQWNTFESMLISYGFVKDHVEEKHIIIPGLKPYLSYSQKTTEASTFHSIAVLDDPADSKETVVKTLNILHDRFQIGNKLQYLVVVGDGKSYDHLIKLKAEYGCVLDWVLPYPGDWHILKNILPIFI